ncbi:protein FATTY ACID EXPORT 2, chloroplastic [Impatiens glandulifera]|uniref:protein FATTY ACID EXPORT 2, chloroplastic n=1 Tax=Impatiens glandulifera TaxID=253017 RepID=UPI001FB05054|nr:protein FATTY ACID EXPORT 2, chloroplastic [Impatiens glandulifera]
MGEYLTLSTESSVLLPRTRFEAFRSLSRSSSLSIRNNTPLASRRLSYIASGQRQLKFLSPSTQVGALFQPKSPNFVVESTGKQEIEVQPDIDGGDGGSGEGGKGGGNSGSGGSGGDNSGNESEGGGGSEGSDSSKKMAMSMSQKLTLGYAALVGVGGLMGYLKSGSNKSLVAGGTAALILFYVFSELPKRPTFASAIGLGISAALLGTMGSRFKKSGKVFPAGVVSIVSFIMTGGYIHGIMRGMH